jgi:tRNA (cytidine/uridine-2'-O-)-methyltransferase
VSEPLLNIVLIRPEIPQNTGSIARLTAATKVRLHLVGPLGFSLEDRHLKRAGLDYWPLVDLRTYERAQDFFAAHRGAPFKLFSARVTQSYTWARFEAGDFLLFGSETKGLGHAILDRGIGPAYRIPIFEPGVRSLNLSNAVSIVAYEALRQLGQLQ